MSAELLERLAALEAVDAADGVEGAAGDLGAVAGEGEARDALHVRLGEGAYALAGAETPHLEAAVLGAAREQLGVAREGEREHRLVVHHEVVTRLVRQVFAHLARGRQDGRGKRGGRTRGKARRGGEEGVSGWAVGQLGGRTR